MGCRARRNGGRSHLPVGMESHLQKARAASVPAGRTRVTAGNFDGGPPGTLETRGSRACIFLLSSPPGTLPPKINRVPAASTARVCWHAASDVTRAVASLVEAEAQTVATGRQDQARVAISKDHRSLMQPWPVATETPPCTYNCTCTYTSRACVFTKILVDAWIWSPLRMHRSKLG